MNKLVIQFQIFLYDAVDLGVFLFSLSLSCEICRKSGEGSRGEEVCVECV